MNLWSQKQHEFPNNARIANLVLHLTDSSLKIETVWLYACLKTKTHGEGCQKCHVLIPHTAKALELNPARSERSRPVPSGWLDIQGFNRSLASEVLEKKQVKANGRKQRCLFSDSEIPWWASKKNSNKQKGPARYVPKSIGKGFSLPVLSTLGFPFAGE